MNCPQFHFCCLCVHGIFPWNQVWYQILNLVWSAHGNGNGEHLGAAAAHPVPPESSTSPPSLNRARRRGARRRPVSRRRRSPCRRHLGLGQGSRGRGARGRGARGRGRGARGRRGREDEELEDEELDGELEMAGTRSSMGTRRGRRGDAAGAGGGRPGGRGGRVVAVAMAMSPFLSRGGRG